MEFSLKISQISNRGNKFAITAGKSILKKFKTVEAAKWSLEDNRDLYNYWAESASVSIDNSEWRTIWA